MTTVSDAVVPPARFAPYRLLDAWRGIASLAVVAFHWGEVARRHSPPLQNNVLYQACNYGGLGVQIFFVISGFVIAATASAALGRQQAGGARAGDLLRSYATARARRIFPTYWAGLALVLLFNLSVAKFAQAEPVFLSPGLMAANVFLVALPLSMLLYLPVSWTLSYETAFYLVIGAALGFAAWGATGRRKSAPTGAGVFLMLNVLHGVTLLSLVWLLIDPHHVRFPFELWPQFGLGVFVYDLLTPPPLPASAAVPLRKRGVWVAFGATLVLMGAYLMVCNVDVGGMSQSAHLTFPTSGCFALLLLLLHRFDALVMKNKVVRGFGFVGLFSYSLYLTHTVVLRGAGQFLKKTHLLPHFHLVAFVLVVALCLLFAYGFFLLFEKPFLSRRKIQEEPVKNK